MALLSVANLVFSYGDRRLLDGANLTLDAGEHVGLVGPNGCGKSTLMRLIAGIERHRPDAGQVQLARGVKAGYLHQDPNLDPKRTLREEAASAFADLAALHDELERVAHEMAEPDNAPEAVQKKLLARYERLEHQMHSRGGYVVDHLIDETLHGLGLEDETFDVAVADLSGGQKGRLALGRLLLSTPDLLLLDEPTNHLDIAARQWLEQFLDEYGGAVIVISHDRWLLDKSVTKIYELEDGRLQDYPGNYEQFRQLRGERRLAARRAYEKQQTRIRHEQGFIDRYRAGQRARQAQGREKRLARYKQDEMLDRPQELDTMRLSFRPPPRSGDRVLEARGIAVRYAELELFTGLDLEVKRGQKIGVIGPNGAGKSTLIRCLLGEQPTDDGAVRLGAQVSVGHYRQMHEHLPMQQTVAEYLRRFVAGGTEQEARDLAGAFLFSGDDQDKPLGTLSGGERSRAALAALVAGGHNLLVLDEPTNHLDIPSCERMEEALRRYVAPGRRFSTAANASGDDGGSGTLIVVTHDRMLLDRLVDQLIVFDGSGGVRHFLGNYSAYAAAEAARRRPAPEPAKPAAAPPVRQAHDKPAQKAQAGQRPKNPQAPPPNRRDRGKPRRAAKDKGSALTKMSQAKLESTIERVEGRLTEIDFELTRPEVFQDGERVKALQAERQALREELAPLEEEWSRRA